MNTPSNKYAFISRHIPTADQFALAEKAGIVLEPIGDLDAFTVTPAQVADKGNFEGVIVVHPAAALRLQTHYAVGVFENGSRAQEGGKPQFFAQDLHLFGGQTKSAVPSALREQIESFCSAKPTTTVTQEQERE